MREGRALAKISRPRLHNVYPRVRLFKQLDQLRRRGPIVWVSGPPGSGKTTLVGSYIDRRRLPGLWCQLDEGDADAGAFFYYLGLAGRRAAPLSRKPLPLLAPEYALGLATFSRNFFRALFARLKPASLLVFDNYQELPTESELHNLLRDGLKQIPEGCTAVIVSRDEPPPALAQLQLNQMMTTLGWEALRLTDVEAQRIARLLMGSEAPTDALRQLHTHAQGWVAGLILLLEQIRNDPQNVQSVTEESPQVLFDYFAGEVFDKADTATQHFLMKTALLPDASASMARALTGVDEAAELLARLNRQNYFTERLHHSETVYRYHPLFREFLLARTRKRFAHTELAQLQQQAAVLLEARAEVAPAAELLLEAQDWSGMSRLIKQHASQLLAEGRHRTLETWLTSFPESHLHEDPWLLYWLGACSAPFQPANARPFFEKAFASFQMTGDTAGMYLAWSEIVDSYVHELQDFHPLDRWLEILERSLKPHVPFPSGAVELRVAASAFMAMLWHRPEHPGLPFWRDKLEMVVRRTADPDQRIRLGNPLVLYCVWFGDFARGNALLEMLRDSATNRNISPLSLVVWYTLTAVYEWLTTGDRDICLQAVDRGLEIARDSGVHVFDSLLLGLGVEINLASGNLGGGAAFLRQMAPVAKPVVGTGYYQFLTGWEALLRDDAVRAAGHAQASLDIAVQVGAPFQQAVSSIELAHALFQGGRPDEAAGCLRTARQIAEVLNSSTLRYVCLLTEAEFALGQGEDGRGLECLRQGLVLGRQNGQWASSFSRPKAELELYTTALRQGIEVDYVRRLIRKRGLIPTEPPWHLDNWPWPVKVYTLGRFSVLRDGEPLRFSIQAQRKRLAMLKALIALGGRGVSEVQMSEALWPDAEGASAHQDFATTLHRLRKLLGYEQAIVLRDRQLRLDAGLCWVDVWAFEQFTSEVEAAKSGLDASALASAEKAMSLYRGPFLAQDTDEPWAVALRERLRSKLGRLVVRLGQHWAQLGEWEHASVYYQKGLEADPLAEEFYRQLMACYAALHRPAEAVAAYKRCKETLAAFGLYPSPETTQLYERLRAAHTR